MPTYAVGDVHGCFDALRGVLADCGFDRDRDRLWLVGDLVNRGPRSLEVLRWATDLGERLGERMVVVAGNHDLHLVSRHAGVSVAKHQDTLDAVLAAPDADELVGWLRRRPLLHREDGYLLVHAGLLPSWTPAAAERRARRVEGCLRDADAARELLAWPLPRESPEDPLRTTLGVLTRLRTCTVDGRPCDFAGPPEEAPPGCLPWFRVPDRRSREVTVICGHWAALGLHREAGVIALDSGAAWGGRLSAVRLEDGEIFQRPVTETRPSRASSTSAMRGSPGS
ncbi:MAG: symmetrical bis(5'-nucleosyl)-tetraphosphatase [Thermoanaerobaculia bacterium]